MAAPRKSSRKSGPTSVGDVLSSTRQVTLQRAHVALDRDTWRRAVGARIAARTEVGALRHKELTIYVASAAWAQELSLLTREILERLRGVGLTLDRLRFRVRPMPAVSASKAPRAGRAPAPRVLPEELRARLERIDDAELRAAISEAAGLSLGRRQARDRTRAAQPTSTRAVPAPRADAGRSAPTDQSRAPPPAKRRGTP